MLTKERVLGTSWVYHRRQEHVDYYARFEVLLVLNEQLDIYIYQKDDKLDLSELENLTLDGLESLVQRRWAKELTEPTETEHDADSSFLAALTVIGAFTVWFFGLWTFIAGIKGLHQKPWEAAIGAALMAAALLAVAIRRR